MGSGGHIPEMARRLSSCCFRRGSEICFLQIKFGEGPDLIWGMPA
jgi:hypothetical protein